MEVALHCMVSSHPSSWSQQLLWVQYAHNTLTSSSMGLSPFQCAYGYQPPLFPALEKEVSSPSVQAFIRQCRRTWARDRTTLLHSVSCYTSTANCRHTRAPTYQVSQRVWLSTRELPLQVKKLAPRFIGPFEIQKIINPTSVWLKLPCSMRVHPTFHISKIKLVQESPLVPAAPSPRLHASSMGTQSTQGLQYLVIWEGYSPEERSLVPASFILDPHFIDDFHRQLPDQPTKAAVSSRDPRHSAPTGSMPPSLDVEDSLSLSGDSSSLPAFDQPTLPESR